MSDSIGIRRGVLAFDLYGTLVDPIAIAGALDRAVPGGHGPAIALLWRQKQVEYSFRVTIMDRYRDFRWITERSLQFALASHGISLPAERRADLIGLYDHLEPFADAPQALRQLAAAGQQAVVFSNGSPAMIGSCLANSGLGDHLDGWFSVHELGAFKPAAAVYRHLASTLQVEPDQVRMVSCNAFDIDGARAAGLDTVWVNRSGGPFDGIGDAPALTIASLTDLPELVSVVEGWR